MTHSPLTKLRHIPLAILTDGVLNEGYGTVFANGIHLGIYKMDLGSAKAVAASGLVAHADLVNLVGMAG